MEHSAIRIGQLGRHLPALDGIRGLAILLVFLFHCFRHQNDAAVDGFLWAWTQCGWIGVDLFFVLSGFLITGILLDTRGNSRCLLHFYARRLLRIFPLYYACLTVVFVLVPALCEWRFPGSAASAGAARLAGDQSWYWLYLQNWLHVLRGDLQPVVVLNHFWSLAVEEQFYLVWPFLVCLVPQTRLPAVCAGLCGFALLLRLGCHAADVPWIATYVCTLTRIDSLCMGAFLAAVIRRPGGYQACARLALPGLVLFTAVTAAVSLFIPVFDFFTSQSHVLNHSLFALTFGALVLVAASAPPRSLAHRLLTLRPLVRMGTYSYAIYIFHFPVFRLVVNWDGIHWVPSAWQPFWICGLTFAITLGLALTSWHLLEKRCLALKRYFPTPAG
jgi:peptidoglycan/LPS O-acetylase OafA/YrhL